MEERKKPLREKMLQLMRVARQLKARKVRPLKERPAREMAQEKMAQKETQMEAQQQVAMNVYVRVMKVMKKLQAAMMMQEPMKEPEMPILKIKVM